MREFKVGDMVRDDQDGCGIVTRIDLSATEYKQIMVQFANGTIFGYSREGFHDSRRLECHRLHLVRPAGEALPVREFKVGDEVECDAWGRGTVSRIKAEDFPSFERVEVRFGGGKFSDFHKDGRHDPSGSLSYLLRHVASKDNNTNVCKGIPMSNNQSFVSRIQETAGKVLAFFKTLLSGDFEAIGRTINTAKRWLLNTPVAKAMRFIIRKARAIMRNPKRWLLALFGVGVVGIAGDQMLELIAKVVDTGMKVAKEWLPDSVYKILEAVVGKVVALAVRIHDALTNNKPVRLVKALLAKVFKKSRDVFMTVKNWVKAKLASKMVESLTK